MNSKKIVKKKNFVIMIKVMMIVLSLLLVVSCVMGTEPNNTGTDGNGGSNGIRYLNFSCDSNGKISATVNGKSINTGAVLGTDVKVGDVICFTAEPKPEHSHYTADWSGVNEDAVSKKRKSATLKVESVSQDISVSVSFREKTDQEILDDTQIENESFYSVQNTSSDDEVKKLFKNGKTASACLGLARKDGDDKLYLITRDIKGNFSVNTPDFIADFSVLKENCKKITEKYEGSVNIIYPLESPTGNEDLCFESVKQVLEWRWQNMKKDFPDSSSPSPTYENTCNPFFFCSGSEPWLTFATTNFEGYPSSIKLFSLERSFLWFAIKTDEKDPEIYFYNGDGDKELVLDWVVTFVKGDETYAFKVGSYFLDGENDNYLYKNLDAKYKTLLMLKLSSLVRISLEKQLMDNGISADVASKKAKAYVRDFEPFKNDFADLESWDVYLTVGEMLEGIYTNGMNPLGAFRNTFKLTGDDAKEFWKQ